MERFPDAGTLRCLRQPKGRAVYLLFGFAPGRLMPRRGGPDPSSDHFGRCCAFSDVELFFCGCGTLRDRLLSCPAHPYGSDMGGRPLYSRRPTVRSYLVILNGAVPWSCAEEDLRIVEARQPRTTAVCRPGRVRSGVQTFGGSWGRKSPPTKTTFQRPDRRTSARTAWRPSQLARGRSIGMAGSDRGAMLLRSRLARSSRSGTDGPDDAIAGLALAAALRAVYAAARGNARRLGRIRPGHGRRPPVRRVRGSTDRHRKPLTTAWTDRVRRIQGRLAQTPAKERR
jgi:hypothetical protein